MYRKIRITVVSLMVMMFCVLSSTGTLSYFTDSDGVTNNFVVGNASTELAVYDDVSGESWRKLDAGNYPALTDNMSDIPFYLQATNNGNIPVYQRFRVVVPIELANVLTLKLDNCTLVTDTTNIDVSTCNNANYSVTYKKSVKVDNEPKYAEYYIISNNAIAVNGKTNEWPTTAIKVGELSNVDNWSQFVTCAESDDNNCSFGVKVYSDAIQTTGFNDAAAAFAEYAEIYN